jgi:hypothetical protein
LHPEGRDAGFTFHAARLMGIHPEWPALRDKLTRDAEGFFAEHADSGMAVNFYALVDAAQVPELRSAEFLAAPFEHISLFSLTKEHGIAKYGALLVPLHGGASAPAFKRLLRSMRHGWTVSWLSSPMDLEALAEHLAGHLNGALADGSDVLVRYYDPRLLPFFLTHLEEEVRSALLAPIARWAWWDRQLDFKAAEGGGADKSPGIKHTDIAAVTQDALAAVAMDELIKSMVLGESEEDEFDDWLPHAFYNAVSVQLCAARAIGLTEVADLQLYVSLAMRVHPDFFELLPAFGAARTELAAGEIGMPAVVLGISDEDWNHLGNTGIRSLDLFRKQINNQLCLTA